MVLNLVAQYFRDATVTTVNSVPNLAWPNSDEQYRATVPALDATVAGLILLQYTAPYWIFNWAHFGPLGCYNG